MSRKTQRNQGITLIKKSNQLIEARYKFDVWETRVFLSVLSQIHRDDEDFKAYRIWYRDVIKSFGLKSGQSYGFLRDAARSLIRKVFNISHIEDGFQRETEYHIIRSINYLTEGERGTGVETQEYVDITIDPDMKPLLLQLQRNFTAYDLRNVVKLGAYPVRVYELLKQYESIGERRLEVDAMKRMFELTTEYPNFGNFFQKIIQPAIEDINAHTDLTITNLERIKEGKKIVALQFFFTRKKEEELRRMRGEAAPKSKTAPVVALLSPLPEIPVEPNVETEKDRLFSLFQADVVQKFGVTPSAFLVLLEHFREEQVAQAVRVTRRAKANQQIKSSVAGFFVQALKSGFTDPQEEAEKQKKREAERAARLATLENQLAELLAEHTARANDKIRELVGAEEGIRTAAVEKARATMHQYILLQYPDESPGVETFREDPILRAAVRNAIMEARPADFSDLDGLFKPQIEALKQEIRALKGG